MAIRLPNALQVRQRLRLTAVSLVVVQLGLSTAHADSAATPVGQLSPSGYWGAINTPTADVVPEGSGVLSLTNSNPERRRRLPAGSFGSLSAAVGLLPGLEVAGRLAYEGDLSCNLFLSDCPGQRDLSVSAKYQLPWRLPLNTRLALGATDFGGAATNFRKYYGVATSELGPLDLSLGYSRASSAGALMDGAFGSVAYRVTDRFTALLENDTQQWRGGLQYRQPLSRDVDLQLATSRKFGNGDAGQQAWQFTAALHVALGGASSQAAESKSRLTVARAMLDLPASGVPSAAGLAQALEAGGFASVTVQRRPATEQQAALWHVRAESRRWRKSQVDAVAAALAIWLKSQGQTGADDLLLTLTYQRQPVLNAFASTGCLREWLQGPEWRCANDRTGLQGRGLMYLNADPVLPEGLQARLQAPVVETAQAGDEQVWMPQVELSANLATRVGTEFGVFDYSLAAVVGAEVALAPGLFWHGTFTVPVSNSRRFDDGEIFGTDRLDTVGFDEAMLSYWTPLPHRVAVQASAGFLDRRYLGGQVDARWSNADGRLRAAGTAGVYRREVTGDRQTPVLGSLRYSVLPARWQVEATAGQFLGGDRGVELASLHWWGDTQMKLYYSNSRGEANSALSARRQLLGFTVSFPLGPRAAQPVGPTWVRGADRWGWGLKTKVGEKDNRLTSGYAEVPTLRHGLASDVSDFDRNGSADLAARANRLRDGVLDGLAAGR